MSDVAPAAAPAAPVAPAATDTSSAAATFGLTGDQSAAPVVPGDTPPADTPPANPDTPPALTMPGKDATPEEWSAFYAQVGRPETPEGYELPVPEGESDAFAKQMAPVLHKHGISAEQAKGLAADWNAMMQAQQEAGALAETERHAAQKSRNEAESVSLRNEWGQQNDANMHHAKLAVQQFLPKEQAGDIISAIESKVGYAATIKFLHSIGKGLAESDAAGLGDPSGGAPVKSMAERLYGSNP